MYIRGSHGLGLLYVILGLPIKPMCKPLEVDQERSWFYFMSQQMHWLCAHYTIVHRRRVDMQLMPTTHQFIEPCDHICVLFCVGTWQAAP